MFGHGPLLTPQPPAAGQLPGLERVLGSAPVRAGLRLGASPTLGREPLFPQPPSPTEQAGKSRHPIPPRLAPQRAGTTSAPPPHGCPSPCCPPGGPSRVLPPSSSRLRHPAVPKPRAAGPRCCPKPKPAALYPQPARPPCPSVRLSVWGGRPARPLPGEGVSSAAAGGFLMANRAGMRRTAAAWVAVPVCHPLSPAPFFPFRGEKKRGGGGQGGDPLSSRGRGRRGGSSPSWGLFSPTDTPVMARSCSPGAHARHGGPASPPLHRDARQVPVQQRGWGSPGCGELGCSTPGCPREEERWPWGGGGGFPGPPALLGGCGTFSLATKGFNCFQPHVAEPGGRGGTQLRWLPRACAGGLGEGRGGSPASSWGSASSCAVREGATCLALPPPAPKQGVLGSGAASRRGEWGPPRGAAEPLACSRTPTSPVCSSPWWDAGPPRTPTSPGCCCLPRCRGSGLEPGLSVGGLQGLEEAGSL